MNSKQFLNWLKRQACRIDKQAGKGGHIKVIRGDRVSHIPVHGGRHRLGKGLMERIKRDLGLK